MDLGLIAFILFIISLAIFIYLKKDKIERQGLIIMTRTDKFREQIKENALRYKTFWNFYFNIGIFVSILSMFFGIILLAGLDILIFSGVVKQGLGLFLPAPTSSFTVLPGVVLAPIWYWLIAVFVLMIPHEFSHALAFAINKIKIKSLGLLLLLFLPGAFAEPDEKQLNKTKKWGKLQVFCAGSFSNIVTAIILVMILNLLLVIAYTPIGVPFSKPLTVINSTEIVNMNNLSTGMIEVLTENNTFIVSRTLLEYQENHTRIVVYEDWPAARNNVSGSIKKINDNKINSMADLSEIIAVYNPGEEIELLTSSGSYHLTVSEKEDLPYLGIETSDRILIEENPISKSILPIMYLDYEPREESFRPIGDFLITLFLLLIEVCLIVGMFNMLPIFPLDGGYILKTLGGDTITKGSSLIILAMIIFAFIGPYLMPLIMSFT